MANPSNAGRGPFETSRMGQMGGGTTGGALEAVQEKAQGLASSVAETAQEGWDTARRAASAVADTASNAWDDATAFMRRYPAATFCAGVAVGALLALACSSVRGSSPMIRFMERSGHDPNRPYGT